MQTTTANRAWGNPSEAMHSEQEYQEEHRLDVRRDRDAELADQDGRQQCRCHRPEGETPIAEAADIVADGQRQEERDLWI